MSCYNGNDLITAAYLLSKYLCMRMYKVKYVQSCVCMRSGAVYYYFFIGFPLPRYVL